MWAYGRQTVQPIAIDPYFENTPEAMAYITNKASDIFISYATRDNGLGWVDRFAADLKAEVVAKLRDRSEDHRLAIWYDKRMAGNVDYNSEILERVRRSATLICLMSDNYLESDWCQKEVKLFPYELYDALMSKEILGNRKPLFKVEIGPVTSPMPGNMPPMNGYNFFASAASGQTFRLDIDSSAYREKIQILAEDIADYLRHVKQKERATERANSEFDRMLVREGPKRGGGVERSTIIFINTESGDRELARAIKRCIHQRRMLFIVEPPECSEVSNDAVAGQTVEERLRRAVQQADAAIITFQKSPSRWVERQQERINMIIGELKLPHLKVGILALPPASITDLDWYVWPDILSDTEGAGGPEFDCRLLDSFLSNVVRRADGILGSTISHPPG